MSNLASANSSADLDNFIEFLYEGLTGYAYLVAKDPSDITSWNQQFFQYPEQAHMLKHYIREGSKKFEMYLGPALYATDKNASKENIYATNVVWCDFDGTTPVDWQGLDPSLIIRSSSEGHEHVYWKLDEPLVGSENIESVTHRLSYGYAADSSGWDATQVLRPPSTFNYKRSLPVLVLSSEDVTYSSDSFSVLPDPPSHQVDTTKWTPGILPEVMDVILGNSFGPDLVSLLKRNKEEVRDRSASLMQFAYGACQSGLTDVEVFVVLQWLDDKWEKFKGRRDRDKRLAHIISVARSKYPSDSADDVDDNPILVLDYRTFMGVEIEVDWVVNDMLLDNGSMLYAGPSGIGKTQLTLQFMKHIALGKDYLGYKIPTAKKVGFFSLEMGIKELQIFMEAQQNDLSEEEIELLSKNLMIIPYGESWALNKPTGQQQLEIIVDQFGLEGVFLDSIGSAIEGNINAQEVVQAYNNYTDRMRKKYSLFWWAIHHTRKSGPGQNVNSQDDVYGDQYLVNRASSVYGILPGKQINGKNTIRMDNWKMRMSAKEKPYYLERTSNLNFKRLDAELVTGVITSKENSDDTTAGKFEL